MTEQDPKKLETMQSLFNSFFDIQAKRAQIASNMRLSRRNIDMDSRAGYSYGTDRDIFGALGYPINLNYAIYYSWYERDPLAKRIIDGPVNATWSSPPDIEEDDDIDETPFEAEVKQLIKRSKLWHNLRRVDKLCGLGNYAGLYLGFSGETPLNQEPIKSSVLIYVRPYGQDCLKIEETESDIQSPRFGLPVKYQITTSDGEQKIVHWSRIIHVVEDALTNDTHGIPRLQSVINYIIAMLLVVGGSAEAFWRVAFPGLAVLYDSDTQMGDLSEFKESMNAWIHQFQRYIRLHGMDVKQLDPNIASPKDVFDALISLLSVGSNIPKRILTGSEIGQLSSEQDRMNWADRINERRRDLAEEGIIRPLFTRLIEYGALPAPKNGIDAYSINWAPMYVPTEKENAEVSEIRTRTVGEYFFKNLEAIWPLRSFFTQEMGYTDEEFDAMQEEARLEFKEEEDFNNRYDAEENNVDMEEQGNE